MTVESNYQWLFRKSPALIVLLNEEGFFVDASDSWLRRFGYGREEIVNMRPQDLATREVAKVISEEYLPMLRRTGRLQGVAVNLVTRDGERVDCLATAIVERSGGKLGARMQRGGAAALRRQGWPQQRTTRNGSNCNNEDIIEDEFHKASIG